MYEDEGSEDEEEEEETIMQREHTWLTRLIAERLII